MITKALNILLVLSVFLSSTGLMLGAHECGISGTTMCVCDNGDGCQDNCCHTDWEYFQSDVEKQAPVVGVEMPVFKMTVVAPPALFTASGISLKDFQSVHSFAYRPPIVSKDISVLFQTFQI